jgi:hypothetical protein
VRRTVRVTPEFFVLLDDQLPHERGLDGEPTAAEFAAGDLLEIVEVFATGWDDLPRIPGGTEYRILITNARLVPFVSVTGQLAPDGAIELVDVEIDMAPPQG